MFTKDELQQLGELLEPINKKLETIVKNMVTKSDLEANNTVLGTIVRVEIAASFQKVENKIDKKLKDHETRITQLEDPEALPRTH